MADRNDMNSMAPEEYSELKKQERAEVFDLLSDATQKLLLPGRLKEYADKQAELFKHSVSNVLLIMEQDPEATWVRSYDDWKADGVTVLKGETGIKTLGSYRFQKEDGTIDLSTTIVGHTTNFFTKRGLQHIPGIQTIDDISIYPAEYFCPINIITDKLHISENTRTIHHYAATWQNKGYRFKKWIRSFIPESILAYINKVKN